LLAGIRRPAVPIIVFRGVNKTPYGCFVEKTPRIYFYGECYRVENKQVGAAVANGRYAV
jgi:hypothetical protein